MSSVPCAEMAAPSLTLSGASSLNSISTPDLTWSVAPSLILSVSGTVYVQPSCSTVSSVIFDGTSVPHATGWPSCAVTSTSSRSAIRRA